MNVRQKALEEAAKIADRFSAKLMRIAMKYHDTEDPDYDRYEELECQASVASNVANLIRAKI